MSSAFDNLPGEATIRYVNRIAELRAVKRVRHGRDFSQEGLARRIGVTRQTLASWEQGATQPSITQAIAIAHALGVTVEELGYR